MASVYEEKPVQYRLVTDVGELRDVVGLQHKVWGPEPVTSMQQMRAAILHGGSVIGAFCEGSLVGFCYGFIGYDGKEPYVGSHMMGIHPEYRDRGIGMRLKLEQRLWAMQAGYGKIVWTFDPFESRNGYLNLCKLGGTVSAYIPEFYGLDAGGYPTDRFVVEWALSSDRVIRAISGQAEPPNDASVYPQLLAIEYRDEQVTGMGETALHSLLGKSNGLRLPVPRAASKLKRLQPDVYKVWQRHFRELAIASFASGYQVVSCHQQAPEVQDYVLERQA
ncbi:Predicted acetyltransferase, GNAT superfamily [Paenibacillus sp. UNCCL117]|uniref:GNAT family N-acetyltransferase n=1 Tax=unclassified Paenibacillus TaxID=185978 RepID=UPI0008853BB9|nr:MULTISPECIES: GNAT family N-acetyltransferase [unclassified Paenibacillus]SDD05161.1 Predicted acetyltransferase, GNAT superfamily [Paenibacillus sp. cl123]SFW31931.1 Predicted acetyltransferase, GNAT superfamily [Paenibacillus sp. UNCCL117]